MVPSARPGGGGVSHVPLEGSRSRRIPMLPQHHQLLLLLGIPWLYSVHAMIDIREESLYIGDPSRGDTRTELAVPTMAKTVKVPPAPWCETESDSDSSGSDLESTTSEDDTSEEEN